MVAAYDVLDGEGLVSRKRGSGTWVVGQAASTARRFYRESWAPRAALSTIVDNPDDVVPFTASTVDRLPDALPRTAFDVSFDELLAYPPYFEIPEGLPDLREVVATMYAERGLPTSPDQIVVTSGAQQAISLLATRYLSTGDLALIETPTFPGAIDAFTVAGARLRGIPVDRHGVDVGAIERTVAQGHVGLTYLIPSFHNPTGTLMPKTKRALLGEIVTRWDAPVVDDESLVDLSLGVEPPAPLAAFAPGARVFTIGSVSKLFWGGLRVGWVRCPLDAVGPLVRLKTVSDLASSLVSQRVALNLFKQRDRIAQLRRRELTHKLGLFTQLLRDQLPTWTFDAPAGGLSLWVNTGMDGEDLAQMALREGVAIVPAADTTVDERSSTFIRLPLMLADELIQEGVVRLRRAAERLEASGSPRPRRLVV